MESTSITRTSSNESLDPMSTPKKVTSFSVSSSTTTTRLRDHLQGNSFYFNESTYSLAIEAVRLYVITIFA